MRKFLSLFLLITAILTTGCGPNIGAGVYFGPSWGTGFGADILFFSSVDKSNMTLHDEQMMSSVKETMRSNGYTVIDSDTPGMTGFKASKHIDNIIKNDVDGLPDFIKKNGSRFVTVNKDGAKNNYRIRAVVDLSGINNTGITANAADSSQRITFMMNFPVKAKNSNAKRVLNNGKSLEWALIPGEKNIIKADFEVNNR